MGDYSLFLLKWIPCHVNFIGIIPFFFVGTDIVRKSQQSCQWRQRNRPSQSSKCQNYLCSGEQCQHIPEPPASPNVHRGKQQNQLISWKPILSTGSHQTDPADPVIDQENHDQCTVHHNGPQVVGQRSYLPSGVVVSWPVRTTEGGQGCARGRSQKCQLQTAGLSSLLCQCDGRLLWRHSM